MRLAESLDVAMLLENPGNRDGAIRALLDRLADDGLIGGEQVPALLEAIIRRDELGPTGIGEGVAVPHAWHAGLGRMIAALGVSRQGIDYPSLDGEPVHIVLLILTPPDRTLEPRKQATFGVWLHHLRDASFRSALAAAGSAEEVRRQIEEADRAAR